MTHLLESPRRTGRAVPAAGRKRPLGVVVLAAVQFGRAALVIGQLLGLNLAPDLDWLHTAAQVPEAAAVTPLLHLEVQGGQGGVVRQRQVGPTAAADLHRPEGEIATLRLSAENAQLAVQRAAQARRGDP